MDKTGFKKMEVGNTWNYKDEGKGAEFKGIYIEKQEHVGDNDSNVYNFDVDGEFMSVWGTTLLDIRFKNLKIGEEIIIEYLGEAESEKRKGKTYHNFNVWHREVPFSKVDEEPLPTEPTQ